MKLRTLWSRLKDLLFQKKQKEEKDPKKAGLVPVPHQGRTIWVTPDYYKESDIRMPVGLPEAHAIADSLGLELPTKEMVDDIWKYATIKLEPKPLPWHASNTTFPVFKEHNSIIETQLAGRAGLIAGHKKDILRARKNDSRVTIYGWHRRNGSVWQPVSRAHTADYKDYSHGLRLVYDPEKSK